jgi:hypothetical protein
MNGKVIGILAVVTIVVGFLAMQLNETPTVSTTQSDQVLYPQLLASLNEVNEIQIKTKTSTISLLKNGTQWGVKEKANYPATMDKIVDILNGIANLSTVEAKTDKAELYSKLEVEDIASENAKSVQVTLKKGNDTVADVIIGKIRPAKGDSSRNEMYLRKVGDKQSWVALGNVTVDRQMADWLDKQVANVEENRIREVAVNRIRVFREKSDDKNYQLADLPEKANVEQPNVRNLTRTLDHLNFDDVMPATEFNFENPTRATFTTFDGWEVALILQTKDGKHYAKVSALAKPGVITGENKEQTINKFQQEITQFNQRLSNWVYIIPDYKAKGLLQKREELFKIPTEENNTNTSKERTNALETLQNLGKP